MQVIYPNLINSISASEEDTDYPVSNLYNAHTTDVWKAESKDATLRCQVAAGSVGSNAIAIFNTNAVTLDLTFRSGSLIIWETGTRWLSNVGWDQTHTFATITTHLPDNKSQWIDYGDQTDPVDVTIDLEAAPGEILYVGTVKAGYSYTFNDPQPGMSEGRESMSIIKDLSYGYTYIKNQTQNARGFGGGLDIVRETDFYTLMHKIALNAGAKPLAWRLVNGLTNQDWVVLAYIVPGGMSGTHSFPLDSEMSFSLMEAI